MCAEDERKRRYSRDSILERALFPSRLPKVSESQLWSYALDLLGPEEEDRVMEMIARDPEAQEELEHIRDSIDSASEYSARQSLLARARAQARAVLNAAGREPSSIAAILVPTDEELALAYENAAYKIMGPPKLVAASVREVSRSEVDVTDQRPMSRPIEIVSDAGFKVSVVLVPDSTIYASITVSKPPLDGEVILWKYASDRQAWKEEVAVPLSRGKASIDGCPDGLLKITLSENRELSFCIASPTAKG